MSSVARGPGPKKVLIVEDDPLTTKLLRTLLALGGYETLEAPTAEEGLALAREHLPDCVIMDIRLPGMDGLAATALIKADAALRSVPVIAVTAQAMAGDEQRAIEAGCDAYLTKPIASGVFLRTVGSFVRPPEPDHGLSGRRVLVVDDEPVVVAVLGKWLRREGYEVIEAAGGIEALRLAAEHPPDLVLLDVRMPGMDGYEVIARLKGDTRTAHVPVILVTGLEDPHDKARGLAAGADEFLTKPVSRPELLVRMTSILRLSRYQEQLRQRFPSDAGQATVVGAEGPGQVAAVVLLVSPSGGLRDVKEILSARAKSFVVAEYAADLQDVGLVVLDATADAGKARDACLAMRERDETRHLPLVVVAPATDPEGRVELLSAGADDVLARPLHAEELLARVDRLLRKKRELDVLQSRYRSALGAATSDGLTGLFNHAYFQRFLALELERSRRQLHPTALVMVDVDDFKAVNDTFGHPAGDQVLREVARCIRASLRDIDLPARYGGEEFAVVLPYTPLDGAVLVAERIRVAVASAEPLVARVTVSVGVAASGEQGCSAEEIVAAADRQLYAAKRAGKNRVSGEALGQSGVA